MSDQTSAARAWRAGAAACAAVWAGAAHAAVLPVYLSARTQIQARANFSGAFNLPNSAFFTNATPVLTDPLSPSSPVTVAFKVAVIGSTGTQGIWRGANGVGSIVYTSPVDGFVSDASINNGRRVAFALDFTSASNGVWVVEPSNSANRQISTINPASLSSFGSPLINDAGRIGMRALIGLVAQGFYAWAPDPAPTGTFTQLAAESPVGAPPPPGPFSFLFTPSFNSEGDIAGKARVGDLGQTGNERPDEIRVFHAGVSGTLIARDRDGDPLSNFASFDNSVALSDGGVVAFIATLVSPANTRAVYISDGGPPVEIARQGVNGVGNIEFFSPSINERGQVAFRAFDSGGQRAIWVGDGAALRVVAHQNDLVTIDGGQTAQISENNPGDPCFGGSPRMNSRGDVVFSAALIPPGQFGVELGSGCFVARAILPGDTNASDSVNFADLNTVLGQFGQTGAIGGGAGSLSGDVNFDGAVNFADLNIVLSNFGMSI